MEPTHGTLVNIGPGALSPDQIDLITRTVAKGCSKDELALFLHACAKTGLDPLMKQIYAVKRSGSLAIQTGIDGFRLIAERSGKYSPGKEPAFTYEDESQRQLVSATAYIKKMTPDGTWHEVAATARYDEYVPRAQNGMPTAFWQKMPHVMLAKVAEALALRRAFPMELSGVYSTEEMTQADMEEAGKEKFPRLRGVKAVEQAPPALPDEPEPTEIVVAPEDIPFAEPPEPSPAPTIGEAITAAQHKALRVAIREMAPVFKNTEAQLTQRIQTWVAREFGREHLNDLSARELERVMHYLSVGGRNGA